MSLSSGLWFTSTLFLKDGVELHLEPGAYLIAAPSKRALPKITSTNTALSCQKSNRSIIYAEDKSDIALTGPGTILTLGLFEPWVLARHERPHMLKFVNCTNVRVQDVLLWGASNWTQLYLDCTNVLVNNITVYALCGGTSDGLTLDSSKNVVVTNTAIDSYDDAISIKSTGKSFAEDILVQNCTLRSAKRGIKIGTESVVGFKNIKFNHCSIEAGKRTIFNPLPSTMKTGIFVSVVDGGTLDNVFFDNISIADAKKPFFILQGARNGGVKQSFIQRLCLKNIHGKSIFEHPGIIASSTAGKIEEIILEKINVQVSLEGKDKTSKKSFNRLVGTGKPKHAMFGDVFPDCSVVAAGIKTLIVDEKSQNLENRLAVYAVDVDETRAMQTDTARDKTPKPELELSLAQPPVFVQNPPHATE